MNCPKCTTGRVLRDQAGDDLCICCGWSPPLAPIEFYGIELRRDIRTPQSRKQDAARAQLRAREGPFPKLRETAYGRWMARGPGWAVMGDTREDAERNYQAAERKHAEIDARIADQEGAGEVV